MSRDIHDLAVGRWRSLLPILGVHEDHLTGRHGKCPICGGADRFRFDDKGGRGSFYCNGCGPGSGVDLVMRAREIPFREAVALIREHLPEATAAPVAAARKQNSDRFVREWKQGHHLDGSDPASRYLLGRGLRPKAWPSMLRYLPRARYFDDTTKASSEHPAMAALFVDAGMSDYTVHYTYLTPDGQKAAVPKPKKLAPCKVPSGGAVRLSASGDVMGIAEGIETALSASQMWGIPVWAALSTGRLIKWQPPPNARKIVIFADNDFSYGGQNAAYSLAYRLRTEGYGSIDVELTPGVDTDWNDVLVADIAAYGVAA